MSERPEDLRGPGGRWQFLGLLGSLGLVVFQALSYYYRLNLSLGPRVVLQPWLLRTGFVLYEHVADLHSPLMPLILAGLGLVFPDGLELAKVVLVVLISLSTVLTFLAARRTIGWPGGLWAAWFFVAWSPTFRFGKLWHEMFLTPLYSLLLVLYEPSSSHRSTRSLFVLGLLGGMAILVKQHAVLVVAALVSWNAVANWYLHRSASRVLRETWLVSFAATGPILAFVLYQYAQAGTLKGFLYWTVGYSLTSEYRIMAAGYPTVAEIGTIASSCLLLPAAILYLVDSARKGQKVWLRLGWGLALLGASSFTVYPRFEYFHLQPALPVLAWLSSLTLVRALRARGSNRHFVIGVAGALLVFWSITAGSAYRQVLDTDEPRAIGQYSNLIPLANEIRQHIGPTDCIYVFPDDEATANLYYLLRCPPPRYWVFDYPWYMTDWIKTQSVSALNDHPPEWVVYFPGRWDIESHAPEIVDYVEDQYQAEVQLHWRRAEVWLLKRSP